MTNSATSLDRLHDIVLPPGVPWWPLAPGWYVIAVVILVLMFVLVHRAWKNWQANAYRRAALRELASAADAPAIGELLRRTALAIAPRTVIAEQTGAAWLDWLAQRCPEPLTGPVREQLLVGIYGRPVDLAELDALRDYAARWIAHHHRPPITDD